MRSKIFICCALLILSGCSSTKVNNDKLYGEMDNVREFGTVLSVSQGTHYETTGVGNALGASAAASAGNSAAAATSSFNILGPVTGLFSSAGNSVASATSSNVTAGSVNTLTYIIKKDDGNTVTVTQTPDVDDPIIYTGQKVMIQSNGQFTKVYPAQVENQRIRN